MREKRKERGYGGKLRLFFAGIPFRRLFWRNAAGREWRGRGGGRPDRRGHEPYLLSRGNRREICRIRGGESGGGRRRSAAVRRFAPDFAAFGRSGLGRIAKGAREAADELGIPVLDAKAQVSFGITVPLTSAAALGGAKAGDKAPEQGREQGSRKDGREGPEDRQVVMTKWAGLEGSAILADLCGEKLRERYPAWLLEEARGMEGFLPVCREAEIAAKAGADALCAAAEGGIFHALWTLAQRAGVGLDIDLKKIPIRQETVEICNALDRNPYGLLSNGSLLCLTPRGDRLVRALQEEGIPAAVIGFAADGNDRVVRNGEETRFLEPAGEDEIYQIWKEKVWI